MTIQVGSVARLLPAIFGDNPNMTNTYGKFGYPGVLKSAIFRVDKIDVRHNAGMCVLATLINAKTMEPPVVGEENNLTIQILTTDLVLTNVKITLDYKIINPRVDRSLVVKELFEQRYTMKKDKLGVASPEMKANWKLIQDNRAAIAKGEIFSQPNEFTVVLPKQRMTLTLSATCLPNETEESILQFKQYLLTNIRESRKARNYVYKDIVYLYDIPLTKVGGVYIEGGQPMKAYEKSLLTKLRADKIPKAGAKATYIGVEIEFIHINNREFIEKMFVKQRLHNHVQVTEDGSVMPCHNNKKYVGSELRILATVDEFPKIINKVCSVLTMPQLDGYVNRSCGLHVHLDIRNRDANLVYRNFYRILDILKTSQPVGRTNSHFCVPNKYEDINKQQEGLMRPKYVLVNPNPFHEGRGTIEIRVHEGSVDAYEIINWGMFLNAMATHDKLIPDKGYKKLESLKNIVDLPLPCINYIDNRIARFNHGGL